MRLPRVWRKGPNHLIGLKNRRCNLPDQDDNSNLCIQDRTSISANDLQKNSSYASLSLYLSLSLSLPQEANFMQTRLRLCDLAVILLQCLIMWRMLYV